MEAYMQQWLGQGASTSGVPGDQLRYSCHSATLSKPAGGVHSEWTKIHLHWEWDLHLTVHVSRIQGKLHRCYCFVFKYVFVYLHMWCQQFYRVSETCVLNRFDRQQTNTVEERDPSVLGASGNLPRWAMGDGLWWQVGHARSSSGMPGDELRDPYRSQVQGLLWPRSGTDLVGRCGVRWWWEIPCWVSTQRFRRERLRSQWRRRSYMFRYDIFNIKDIEGLSLPYHVGRTNPIGHFIFIPLTYVVLVGFWFYN